VVCILAVFSTLGFVRFKAIPPLWVEGFYFAVEHGRYALAKMTRFIQKIIKMPQSLSKQRRLQRIHGDRRPAIAISTPFRRPGLNRC